MWTIIFIGLILQEKAKKSVRFNMDNNKTHEFSVESASTLSLDDGAFIANVLDATDLFASDSELSECDEEGTDGLAPKESVRFAFTNDVNERKDKNSQPGSFDAITSKVCIRGKF